MKSIIAQFNSYFIFTQNDNVTLKDAGLLVNFMGETQTNDVSLNCYIRDKSLNEIDVAKTAYCPTGISPDAILHSKKTPETIASTTVITETISKPTVDALTIVPTEPTIATHAVTPKTRMSVLKKRKLTNFEPQIHLVKTIVNENVIRVDDAHLIAVPQDDVNVPRVKTPPTVSIDLTDNNVKKQAKIKPMVTSVVVSILFFKYICITLKLNWS